MHRVFVSYRRDDSFVVKPVIDELKNELGEEEVFVDVTMGGGDRINAEIRKALQYADVVVVPLGPTWIKESQTDGRLHDQKDYVRLELEIADALGLRIVPVEIGDSIRIPDERDLPESLSFFGNLNSLPFRDNVQRVDIDRLIERVRYELRDPNTIRAAQLDDLRSAIESSGKRLEMVDKKWERVNERLERDASRLSELHDEVALMRSAQQGSSRRIVWIGTLAVAPYLLVVLYLTWVFGMPALKEWHSSRNNNVIEEAISAEDIDAYEAEMDAYKAEIEDSDQ